MGQAVAEAQRERELSKQALEAQVGALEARVRHELDWKAKLRRHGPRYVVIGVATAALITGVIVLRVRFGKQEEKVEVRVSSMEDVARQLAEIRKELDKRQGKERGPMWQKLALRVATAAAAAGGTLIARQLMERYAPGAGAESPSDNDPYTEAGRAARAASV